VDYLTPGIAPCGVSTGRGGEGSAAGTANGGNMKRQVTRALLAAGTAAAICAATAVPAAAATTGSQTFSGTIVTSGVSGTRTVIHSVIIAKGVFRGLGRIVELPNLPGDPPEVMRDDLVFPGGTMHLSRSGDITSFSLNPHNCMVKVTVQNPGEITGGTRQFAGATGSFPAGTATAHGLGARDRDGSCSMTKPLLHEVDRLASSGTLSF
jgi:hypothetical protein